MPLVWNKWIHIAYLVTYLGIILEKQTDFVIFQPSGKEFALDSRLFKYMVMGHMHDTIIMIYMYYKQMDSQIPSGNVFVYITREKN